MSKTGEKSEKGAIEIIEEAVHLLRFSPPAILLIYYIGGFPFILVLLFFLGNMSRNAFALEYCAGTSLIVATFFIWMKCWHAVFQLHVIARIGSRNVHKWSFRRIIRLVALQTIFQSSGLFLLIASIALFFPLGWVFAFYQNITLERYEKPLDLKSSLARSIYLSRLWPRQNHFILLILSLFSMFVFLNVGTVLIFIPFLLNKLLGIETVFTLSGIHFYNTTFFAVALGITYLCVDPIIKVVYALRYFYGLSLKSGDDLRVDLKRLFRRHSTAFALFILIILPIGYPGAALGGEPEKDPVNVSQSYSIKINSERLNHSIEEVMARPEFAWRLPREKKNDQEIKVPGFFSFVQRWTKKIAGAISGFIQRLSDWLKKFTPKRTGSTQRSDSDWTPLVKGLLFLFICLASCTAAVYLFRFFKRRKRTTIATATAVEASVPDLRDEQVSADDLPVDRWIELAKDLIRKKSLRLALRALYFATISHLASRNMVLIAPYKSNREYETELQRRAHEEKELVSIFSKNVRLFDWAWYGMYHVTMKHVKTFYSNYKRITALAP
jgi:hypothetical protein